MQTSPSLLSRIAIRESNLTLDEPSRKPEEVATDGRITWRIPLQAGEKQELTFGILVEYPKDREIVGLQ